MGVRNLASLVRIRVQRPVKIRLNAQTHEVDSVPTCGSRRQATICPMYSPQVLDHFEHPRNAGEVTDPQASVQIDNPVCGDILRLTLRIAEGRVSEIRFRAKGCVSAMACASLLTELVSGRTLADARRLRREELTEAIGGLPEASAHASALAIDALRAALDKVRG